MRKRLKIGFGSAVLVGGLLATGIPAGAQSPSSSPSSSPQSSPQSPQSPNSSSGGMGRSTDSSVDQMQRQTEQKMDDGAKKMAKNSDEAFAIKAAQGGHAEMKMGKLAAEKGGDADVKAFGQQMVDDHTKVGEKLKSIAEEKGMKLPEDMSPKQQGTYEKLSQLSGPEFDKAYVKAMVKDHEEDVKDFTKESNKGKDEKIKSFATENLPTLQGHLDKIKGIQGKMSSTASSTK